MTLSEKDEKFLEEAGKQLEDSPLTLAQASERLLAEQAEQGNPEAQEALRLLQLREKHSVRLQELDDEFMSVFGMLVGRVSKEDTIQMLLLFASKPSLLNIVATLGTYCYTRGRLDEQEGR